MKSFPSIGIEGVIKDRFPISKFLNMLFIFNYFKYLIYIIIYYVKIKYKF